MLVRYVSLLYTCIRFLCLLCATIISTIRFLIFLICEVSVFPRVALASKYVNEMSWRNDLFQTIKTTQMTVHIIT